MFALGSLESHMFFRAVMTMLVIIMIALAVCNWSRGAAYNVLQQSQHFFEPDDLAAETPEGAMAATKTTRRSCISPLAEWRAAAKQRWRRASCKSLLDENYEWGHVK